MKRIFFFFFLNCFFLILNAETFVVCVGIADYKDSKIPSLKNTENDAGAISDFYKNGKAQVVTLIGNDATKSAIISSVKHQFGKAKKGDKIVFYFSGHGYPGGFCPYDMRSVNYRNNGCGLTYQEILKIMKSSEARTKMMFVDACNSGAIRSNESDKIPETDNVMLFLSSRGSENSMEPIYSQNGYFTKNLIRGLRGAADKNRDKIITAREIFEYVSIQTQKDTRNRQHPVMWGKFPDDMVIVRYNKIK